MPGPNRAPRGGYQKPKNLGKTISRLVGYLTRSKLPLLFVLLCLLVSVCSNIDSPPTVHGSFLTLPAPPLLIRENENASHAHRA